jgi:hypothetical protein
MVVKPLSVRALGEDVILALTIGGLGKQEPIRYDKIQTFTLLRRNGRWRCAAFQNTKMSARAEEAFNRE